jgi:hypothetical protein
LEYRVEFKDLPPREAEKLADDFRRLPNVDSVRVRVQTRDAAHREPVMAFMSLKDAFASVAPHLPNVSLVIGYLVGKIDKVVDKVVDRSIDALIDEVERDLRKRSRQSIRNLNKRKKPIRAKAKIIAPGNKVIFESSEPKTKVVKSKSSNKKRKTKK